LVHQLCHKPAERRAAGFIGEGSTESQVIQRAKDSASIRALLYKGTRQTILIGVVSLFNDTNKNSEWKLRFGEHVFQCGGTFDVTKGRHGHEDGFIRVSLFGGVCQWLCGCGECIGKVGRVWLVEQDAKELRKASLNIADLATYVIIDTGSTGVAERVEVMLLLWKSAALRGQASYFGDQDKERRSKRQQRKDEQGSGLGSHTPPQKNPPLSFLFTLNNETVNDQINVSLGNVFQRW
jgi:hypothetical protein